MRTFSLLIATVAAIAIAPCIGAAASVHFIDPALPGVTQYDEWENLTASANPGYPGFPGSGVWPNPIGSNVGASGDATLNKTANGTGGAPYPAGGSLYYGGFSGDINNDGGQLTVTDSTPVPGVSNVVFQVEIGEAWTYDFFNNVYPALSYNGLGQNLAPTTSVLLEQVDNGTVTMPTGPETVYINTWLFQWDLSGIGDGPVNNFSVAFNGVQHAQAYGFQLDQSSAFVAVPEPATCGLAAVSGLVGVITAARRRRSGRS